MQKRFKRAAEIAAVVPESMQEAAFLRALDLLTETESNTRRESATPPPTKRHTTRKPSTRSLAGGETESAVDRVAQVMAISRDNAPEVDAETSVQGLALALLVVASREAGVDGLTAPEIAKILTEKFRHRTSRQAVMQALDSAGNKVDRQKNGNAAALYRVMRAGEDWLAMPAEQRTKPTGAKVRRRSGPRKAASSKTTAPPAATAKPAKQASAKKRVATKVTRPAGGRKPGPKAALETLIGEGFFATARGLGDIKLELRDQKALTFTSTDLSPALTRLLRERKLTRSKVDKQYEYTAV